MEQDGTPLPEQTEATCNHINDLPRIDVPTLIVHGDADRILPFDSTAARLPKLIKDSQLVVIPGGPHAIIWTHADRVNPVVLKFLKQEQDLRKSA